MMIGFDPARTFILDTDPDVALERGLARLADSTLDEGRFEKKGLSFQERLREGFRDLARSGPGRYRLVDASGTPQEVLGRLCEHLPSSLTDKLDAVQPSFS